MWALATAGFLPKYTHVFDTTLVPEKNRPTMSDIQKDPITECFAAVGGELMRRPQDFKDQEVKDVLWAFSRVRFTLGLYWQFDHSLTNHFWAMRCV